MKRYGLVSLLTTALMSINAFAGNTEVIEEAVFDAPPERVWNRLKSFCSIDQWQSYVADCSVYGTRSGVHRIISMQDGSIYTEALTEYSESQRRFAYVILSGPLPIQNYQASFSIEPTDNGQTRLTWGSTFDVPAELEAEAISNIRALYQNGIAGMRNLIAE
ncbi:MAG: SRPBCC family protein [Aquisalimonadaceae bacterium]